MRGETQRDETGEAVLHFGAALDITEPARDKRELAESAEQLRHLFAAMSEGFGYSRIVRDDQGRPVDWVTDLANPALEKLLGLGCRRRRPGEQQAAGPRGRPSRTARARGTSGRGRRARGVRLPVRRRRTLVPHLAAGRGA